MGGRVKQADLNERFEKTAEEFKRDTGFIAPGKSIPMEMATEDYEARRRVAWTIWLGNRTTT